MTVGPVLVTVEAPRTAKLCAEPSGGADCAQPRLSILNMQITNSSFFISKLLGWISHHRRRQGGDKTVESTSSFQTGPQTNSQYKPSLSTFGHPRKKLMADEH
jgi:hypothetical protein